MATPSKRKPRRKNRGNIETLRNGSLRVRVYAGTDPITRKRYDLKEFIPAGPDAEKRADAALVRLVNEINERRHPKTSATVNQLLDKYLDVSTVGRTTLSRYRELADHHVRPLIGSVKAGRLDGEIIDSLYTELRRCNVHCTNKRAVVDHRTRVPHTCDERCMPHQCTPLAEGTIRKIHYLLSGAYKKATYWGWVSINPMDQTEPPAPSPANPQPPTADEAGAILSRAWRNDPDWGTQVWLAMITGSRRGEICAIRWRHVDLENGVLHMEKAIAQDGSEIWEKDTKTHQDRRIVIDPDTVELLTEHRARMTDRTDALGIEFSKDAFVFTNEPDGSAPMRPQSVSQKYRQLVRSLSIDTHLHALRDYSATELIAAGVDIRTVAGRLGHGGGGSTTLRVYAAWLSEADQRASQALTSRLPERPRVEPDPVERAKTAPEAPYERIAAEIRSAILSGKYQPGNVVPTVKELESEHGVSAGTANRAIGLLKTWGLVEGSRGRRATVLHPPDETPNERTPTTGTEKHDEPSPQPEGQRLLDLRLLYMGEEVRTFTALADPQNPHQLRQLLTAAAHRHGGREADVADYELEVREAGRDELITNFATL